MTSLKPIDSQLQLAELAIENGWSVEEVARTLLKMTGPVAQPVVPQIHREGANSASKAVVENLSKFAASKR